MFHRHENHSFPQCVALRVVRLSMTRKGVCGDFRIHIGRQPKNCTTRHCFDFCLNLSLLRLVFASMKRFLLLFAVVLMSFNTQALRAQRTIRHISFEKKDVFDTTQNDWFFAAGLFNTLHTTTRDYVIEDELLFQEGDELDDDVLDETERNLRRTGLFTAVRITTTDVGEDQVDVVVHTQDKWSTMGAVLFGTGGGATQYGGSLSEENLAGTGILLGGQALHRSENNIGWQGYVNVTARRLARTNETLQLQIQSNRLRTDQLLSLDLPYRTLHSPLAFDVSVQNSYGDDFYYNDGAAPKLLPFHVRKGSAWISGATTEGDRYYWSALLSIEDVHRLSSEFRQAYDNSGKILFSLGSLRQSFAAMPLVDSYDQRDLTTGAWGQATFGYIFPMNGDGERLVYVGARAEESGRFRNNTLYLYGMAEAASAFSYSSGRYTSVESVGLGHYFLTPGIVLTARMHQQTVWNWNAFHQLILDNDMGLRGYPLNQLSGDNRLLSNIELRFFPHWDLWIFHLGAAAFFDGGFVWNQGTDLSLVHMHNAVGLGLRFYNSKVSGPAGILRIDFAYNLDDKKWAGIIFSSDQLFSAFGSHTFRPPSLSGTTIDVQ